jgi:spore maturation protein CgeB
MKIIHFGPEDNATSLQRIKAFKELTHDVSVVYYSRLDERIGLFTRIYRGFRRRAGFPAEQCNENKVLLEVSEDTRPDIIFVEKGLTIRPSTLKKIRALYPQIVLVCYSLDDIMNPGNQSKYYIKSVPLYDVHFTTKDFNVNEIMEFGAQRVELTGNAFSTHEHKPIEPNNTDLINFGCDVSFVGGYEFDRAQILNELALNGITVRIWGNNWHKFKNPHKGLIIEFKPAFGKDYARVVCNSKIMLGFLRKINRDVETTRTVEIPAFKGFLLAERTAAQQNLFEEGEEAEYFDDFPELFDKIKFYLNHDEKRKIIAHTGFKRCQISGYSYNDQMKKVLNLCSVIQHKNKKYS